jgi:hypothetical protein
MRIGKLCPGCLTGLARGSVATMFAALTALSWTGVAAADETPFGWTPGWTLAPYGWLAGLDGTIGSKAPDTGGGPLLPPRLDVSVDDQLEQIGFMFFGEWRGDRWMAFVDTVWANVSQDADIKVSRLLPESDSEATIDGNIYQAAVGYRLLDWDRSYLVVYGGGRYYDLKAEVEAKGGVLPRKIETSTTRSWTDAMIGGRWSYGLGKNWTGFVLADYGVGQSNSTWQIFGNIGYNFSWGSVVGGYRYMNLDYDTSSYKINLSLSGPLLGVAISF